MEKTATQPAFATLALAALVMLAILASGCEPTAPDNGDLERAAVERIVDGDTIDVDRGSGDERVRLIGIDAPESKSPDEDLNTQEGKLASEFLMTELSAGAPVYLETDTRDTDKYGRLLRYVWTDPPNDREADAEDKMLNARIVAAGYAQAKRYPPDTRYADVLDRLQEKAVSAGAGVSYLWG